MIDPAPRHPCLSCAEPIKNGAKLCPHCQAKQTPTIGVAKVLKLAGAFITVFSLIFAIEQAWRLGAQYRESRAHLEEQINTARTLINIEEFEAAWKLLVEMLREKPNSSVIRAAVFDLASTWLLQGRSTVQSTHLQTALVVCAVNTSGEERANLEALAIYARILRDRNRSKGNGWKLEFQRALKHEPRAFFANFLFGYWQITSEENVRAGSETWKRALDIGQDSVLAKGQNRALVRQFQLETLLRGLRRSIGAEERNRYRGQLLKVLQSMHKNGEESPDVRHVDAYVGIYLGTHGREAYFASSLPLIPVQDQLDILESVQESMGVTSHESSSKYTKFQLIRSRLLEELGRDEEALDAIRAVDIKRVFPPFVPHLDAAVERLTGKPPEDLIERDPWKVHTYNLGHKLPDSDEFQEGIIALTGWSRIWRSIGNRTYGGKIPDALDAAIGSIAAWHARPELTDDDRASAKLLEYNLRAWRGALLASIMQFDRGVGELEALAINPNIPQELRAEVLFSLAEAYQDTDQAVHPDLSYAMIYTDRHAKVRAAYMNEAFSRLKAALEAGYDNWNRIEISLKPLRREHPHQYSKLSLKYGRVPPQEE